jgi:hypothetical protein
MKLIKRILLVLIVLVVVFLCVGFLLPSHYKVERSITMKSQPEKVYPIISDLKTWNSWTAWNDRKYPDMKATFSGSDSGSGAKMNWDGKDVGQGALEVTKGAPTDGIEYILNMNQGQFRSNGAIKMKLTDQGLEVRWVNEGDLGMNPINRYIGLLMDHFMAQDLEEGLRNLKNATEVH